MLWFFPLLAGGSLDRSYPPAPFAQVALEGEIIRKCLARTENQCSFIEYQNYKCIYRRYASLFFIVAVDNTTNELSILEFIHCLVETLDKYFENVCELDVRTSCSCPPLPLITDLLPPRAR
jgi:hypothetical protein